MIMIMSVSNSVPGSVYMSNVGVLPVAVTFHGIMCPVADITKSKM